MIPAFFASLALGFSLLANTYCETIAFPPDSTNINGLAPTLKFSVWYQQQNNQCVDYPNSVDIDAKWKTARAFSIIAPVIGGFLAFFAWLAPCMNFGEASWKKAGLVFILVTLFQGFTLFLLSSNACINNPLVPTYGYQDTCELEWGTKLNITSVVFWFIAGVVMKQMPAPTQPPRPPPETQTVTYTKIEKGDGTPVVQANVVKGTYVAEAEQPEV